MLTRLDLRGAGNDLRARLPRPDLGGAAPVEVVREILTDVRKRGDAAVRGYTERFDGAAVDELGVDQRELDRALADLPPLLREALEAAQSAVLAYHRHQLRDEDAHVRDGVTVRDLRRPVDRAGVYVPGGRAPLLSTVLMTATPARVAGVDEVVLCSPPGPDGRIADGILAAAALAGVDAVYRVGGAQAIAAMAYGTETIPSADVIVGPGNVYVATAKREVGAEGVVGVPGAFAGPSEVVVVADEATPPELAAIDVVVQAEHGPDGLAWLVTWSDAAADAVSAAVERIVAESPRRQDLESTLSGGGYAAVVDGPEQAAAVVNVIAPEHLELLNADPDSVLVLVRHAGAVFCGLDAPASVGDYLAGPSHVLPTYGTARFAGGLRVDDFLKWMHVVSLDDGVIGRLAPHVAAIAEAEGLPAHAESVRLRGRP
ncbi:MAG TPA: histidinol dehydrogenase [Acidimicrobiia bacterium]|nr:histidinol dehydrogenase [Acidimicrobiia bacterium]